MCKAVFFIDKRFVVVYNKNTPKGYLKEMKYMEEKCCQCYIHDKKTRSEDEKRTLANRLSRIEGQVRGLRAMLERDAYCPDILTQSSAVIAALNSFNKELLASHIKGCVANDIKGGNDETVDELVATLYKLMK